VKFLKPKSMKNLHLRKVISTGLVLFITCICFQAFSQRKADAKVPKGSYKLEYKYLSDKFIQYVNKTKMTQDLDLNGQSMLVYVNSFLKCGIKASGKNGDNLKLMIRIDSMKQDIDSPQGMSGGDVTDAMGKEFELEVAPSGKITDLSGAAKLVLNLPTGSESDASESFIDFFPVLPTEVVKKGDTWVTNDTIKINGKNATRWMPVKSECIFEGIEKVNGMACAKISVTISGTMKMVNQAQGMEITVTGDYTGTKILLFAVKEGFFISETSKTKMKGSVDIPDQGMTLPVVIDIDAITEMVK